MNLNSKDIDNLKSLRTTTRNTNNFGMIYHYNDDVIKIFKDGDFIDKYNLESHLKELSKLNVNGVALPKELVYIDGKFKGYTMPYYKGFTLSIILKKIMKGKIIVTPDEVNRLYNELINKVIELSKLGVKIHDIRPNNIIYYNNELCLIDCDFYRISNMENLMEYNISLVEEAVKKYTNNIFNVTKYKDDKLFEFSLDIKSN